MTDEEIKPFIGKKVEAQIKLMATAGGYSVGYAIIRGVLFIAAYTKGGTWLYHITPYNDKFYAGSFVKITLIETEKDDCAEKAEYKKPPLGLRPKFVADEQRRAEIIAAIQRFGEAGKPIPQEWIDEYNELCKENK